MLNGKAGANVNSNVGTQKSTEKISYCCLRGTSEKYMGCEASSNRCKAPG